LYVLADSAELSRRDAEYAFEVAIEMALVCKPSLASRRCDWRAFTQAAQRVKYASMELVAVRWKSNSFPERARKVKGAQSGQPAQVVERHVFGKVCIQVFAHLGDSAGRWRQQLLGWRQHTMPPEDPRKTGDQKRLQAECRLTSFHRQVQLLEHGKRLVVAHDGLSESRKPRRLKAGIDEGAFGETKWHVKGPVREAVVINGAILVYLTRVKEDQASGRHLIGAVGMPQTLNTANHKGDEILLMEMPREGVATV
jgi:hypothetical protein